MQSVSNASAISQTPHYISCTFKANIQFYGRRHSKWALSKKWRPPSGESLWYHVVDGISWTFVSFSEGFKSLYFPVQNWRAMAKDNRSTISGHPSRPLCTGCRWERVRRHSSVEACYFWIRYDRIANWCTGKGGIWLSWNSTKRYLQQQGDQLDELVDVSSALNALAWIFQKYQSAPTTLPGMVAMYAKNLTEWVSSRAYRVKGLPSF